MLIAKSCDSPGTFSREDDIDRTGFDARKVFIFFTNKSDGDCQNCRPNLMQNKIDIEQTR